MIIAVDAAGGDHYPDYPVQGAVEAVQADDRITVLLLGPQQMLEDELAKYDFDSNRIQIVDAPQIIGMDDSPSQAVKTKQESSIVRGLGLQKQGKADGFISAGNTGALLAASTYILGRLKHVMRPTVASLFPTVKGFRLLVDAGANLELKPPMYAQFGIMGAVYAEEVMQVSDPKIGLLNVGEEEEKGLQVHCEAHDILSKLPNFVGNIEGRDIFPAKADIMVTDGFTGNLILKFGESVPDALKTMVGKTIKEMKLSEEQQQLIYSVLKKSLTSFDYQLVGGVPFLGVDGISMVGHGGSTPLAFKNLILNAARAVEVNVNDKMIAALESAS
jgi:glycerol-3-phosphate acyltransferase PlsX